MLICCQLDEVQKPLRLEEKGLSLPLASIRTDMWVIYLKIRKSQCRVNRSMGSPVIRKWLIWRKLVKFYTMIERFFEICVIIISEDSSLPKIHLISISNELCRFSQSLLHAPFCPSNIRGLYLLFSLFYVGLILIARPPTPNKWK